MEWWNGIVRTYVFVLGIILINIGIIELFFPYKVFSFWRWWTKSKIFFLYGFVLIGGGFPLTVYNGPLSGIIFIIGLIVVFTGPFIILFPEKIRATFASISEEYDGAGIKKIIRAEALLRTCTGILFIMSYIL